MIASTLFRRPQLLLKKLPASAIGWLALLNVSLLLPNVVAETSASAAENHKAVVRELQNATVRIETPQNRSSGVIVSTAGYVLTVAHGLRANESKIIVLHQTQSFTAKLIVHDADRDVALLKIERGDPTAAFPLVLSLSTNESERLQNGQPLIATGFPAREDDPPGPVVRLGAMAAKSKRFIRSSCVLTAGDSGGPVVTQNGSLVGINARIGTEANTNLHIPMPVIRRALAASRFRITESLERVSPPDKRGIPQPVLTALKNLQVNLTTPDGDDLCGGCRISNVIIAAKLSELDGRELRCRMGSTLLPVQVIHSNRQCDIALLKASHEQLPRLSGVALRETALDVGELVYSDDTQASIVSRLKYTQAPATAALGCSLEIIDSELVVERVVANSACADAGLAAGDRLLEFCGRKCQSLDDVGRLLSERQPGDMVRFVVKRKQMPHQGLGRLRHQADSLLDRSEFLDGRAGILSSRRTGFERVIQHDSHLSINLIAGPLVDAAGRLVGVNIARRSRESVLAVPIEDLFDLLKKTSAPDDTIQH